MASFRLKLEALSSSAMLSLNDGQTNETMQGEGGPAEADERCGVIDTLA